MNLLTTIVLALAVPAGWPLSPDPSVVRPFEPPAQTWLAGHRGADLTGTPGQTVVAAAAGTVTFAGRIAGVGVVVLSHGDTRSTYQPVSATVRRGQTVAEGDPIGSLERLGSHCPPAACLHWGLVRGEEYLDPLALVGSSRPVRLFPGSGGGGGGGAPATTATPGPAPAVRAFLSFLDELAGRLAGGTVLTPEGAPAGRPSAAGRW